MSACSRRETKDQAVGLFTLTLTVQGPDFQEARESDGRLSDGGQVAQFPRINAALLMLLHLFTTFCQLLFPRIHLSVIRKRVSLRHVSIVPLHRTSSYQDLNRSTFPLPSCRHRMQSDFLRRYESKLCNDSEINPRLCGLDLVSVGAAHRLAASALDRKQALEPTAASLPPLHRCDSVGDKFAHPRSARFPPRQPSCPMQ